MLVVRTCIGDVDVHDVVIFTAVECVCSFYTTSMADDQERELVLKRAFVLAVVESRVARRRLGALFSHNR